MVKEIETKKEKLKRTKKPLFILFALLALYLVIFIVIEIKEYNSVDYGLVSFLVIILLSFFISPLIPIIFVVYPASYTLFLLMDILIFGGGGGIEINRGKQVVCSFLVLIYSTYLIFSKQYEFPYTFKGIYNILKS